MLADYALTLHASTTLSRSLHLIHQLNSGMESYTAITAIKFVDGESGVSHLAAATRDVTNEHTSSVGCLLVWELFHLVETLT